MNAIILSPKCRICGKHRHRAEILLNPTIGYCIYCHASYMDALNALATGQPPTKCAECEKPFRELSEDPRSGDVLMTLTEKDGVRVFLCQPCSSSYDRKQRQRFQGTAYGMSLN